MAAAPRWKIYDANGKYQAATKEVEAAAALVAFYGPGSKIKWDHKVLAWEEGIDGDGGNSYDEVAILAKKRLNAYRVKMGWTRGGGPQ